MVNEISSSIAVNEQHALLGTLSRYVMIHLYLILPLSASGLLP